MEKACINCKWYCVSQYDCANPNVKVWDCDDCEKDYNYLCELYEGITDLHEELIKLRMTIVANIKNPPIEPQTIIDIFEDLSYSNIRGSLKDNLYFTGTLCNILIKKHILTADDFEEELKKVKEYYATK